MNRTSKPIALAVLVVPLFSAVSDAQALPREQAEIVCAAADAAVWADVTITITGGDRETCAEIMDRRETESSSAFGVGLRALERDALNRDEPGPIVAIRTPDERFAEIPDYPFAPHYAMVDEVRIHYLDEGPRDAAPVVLLHGEPSWSFLYRKMIPVLTAAGNRVVAPDLVGFGKSDKPVNRTSYSIRQHVDWLRGLLLDELQLTRITLFGQDWGGIIGLHLVAEQPDSFACIVAANTALPTGDPGYSGQRDPSAFLEWRRFSQEVAAFPAGEIVQLATVSTLPPEVVAAYDAPFPDERYKAGARVFPVLVPITPDYPGAVGGRAAWEVLSRWEKPFLTLFSDSDPVTGGLERPFHENVPGARGQPHRIIAGAGHFLQEDAGEEIAELVSEFIAAEACGIGVTTDPSDGAAP